MMHALLPGLTVAAPPKRNYGSGWLPLEVLRQPQLPLPTPFKAPAARECQFPIGTPGRKGFHFCGAPTIYRLTNGGERKVQTSWCASHFAVVFVCERTAA